MADFNKEIVYTCSMCGGYAVNNSDKLCVCGNELKEIDGKWACLNGGCSFNGYLEKLNLRIKCMDCGKSFKDSDKLNISSKKLTVFSCCLCQINNNIYYSSDKLDNYLSVKCYDCGKVQRIFVQEGGISWSFRKKPKNRPSDITYTKANTNLDKLAQRAVKSAKNQSKDSPGISYTKSTKFQHEFANPKTGSKEHEESVQRQNKLRYIEAKPTNSLFADESTHILIDSFNGVRNQFVLLNKNIMSFMCLFVLYHFVNNVWKPF